MRVCIACLGDTSGMENKSSTHTIYMQCSIMCTLFASVLNLRMRRACNSLFLLRYKHNLLWMCTTNSTSSRVVASVQVKVKVQVKIAAIQPSWRLTSWTRTAYYLKGSPRVMLHRRLWLSGMGSTIKAVVCYQLLCEYGLNCEGVFCF